MFIDEGLHLADELRPFFALCVQIEAMKRVGIQCQPYAVLHFIQPLVVFQLPISEYVIPRSRHQHRREPLL